MEHVQEYGQAVEHWPLRSLTAWWKACRSPVERLAAFFLGLLSLAIVFSIAVTQILVVLLTALWLVREIPQKFRYFHRTPLDIPYLVFIMGRLISVFFSVDLQRSLSALYIEFFFYIVFFLTTQLAWKRKDAAAWVLTSAMLLAGATAAALALGKVFLSLIPRASSTTAGPYTLGGYLTLVLPLGLVLYSGGTSPWARGLHNLAPSSWTSRAPTPQSLTPNTPAFRSPIGWRPGYAWLTPVLRLLPLLLVCAGIVFTFNRLHWAAMGAVLIAFGLLTRKRLLLISLVLLLIGSLLWPSVRVRVAQLGNPSAFMTGRDVLWEGATMLLPEHPITGFGPRTFHEIFPLFDRMPIKGVGSWHNDYLQVYMESGLIGLLPLLWLVGAIAFQSLRKLRSTPPSESRLLTLALFSSVGVAIIFGGMLDTLVGIQWRILLGLLALQLSPDLKLSSDLRSDLRSDVTSDLK